MIFPRKKGTNENVSFLERERGYEKFFGIKIMVLPLQFCPYYLHLSERQNPTKDGLKKVGVV